MGMKLVVRFSYCRMSMLGIDDNVRPDRGSVIGAVVNALVVIAVQSLPELLGLSELMFPLLYPSL